MKLPLTGLLRTHRNMNSAVLLILVCHEGNDFEERSKGITFASVLAQAMLHSLPAGETESTEPNPGYCVNTAGWSKGSCL